MAYRIMLVGGGTSGHVYPLIAVAEELKKQSDTSGDVLQLRTIGDTNLLRSLSSERGIKFNFVLGSKWRRYFSFLNFLGLFKLPIGFFQSLFYIWLFMPDLVFVKGGYASFLPAIVAKLLFIPIYIHETDSVPGMTNVIIGKFAKKVYLAMEIARPYFNNKNIEVVGNPIRSQLLQVSDKNTALASFGFNSSKPTILITGANQGAKIINDTLLLALVELSKKFQIIHQTGGANLKFVQDQVSLIVGESGEQLGQLIKENYKVFDSLNIQEMSNAYSACDVIVSRSGSQIFETAAIGKPTVLIPLENSARNHQLKNAMEVAKFGAIVIEESNLSPHILINQIEKAFDNRLELSEKIKKFSRTDAATVMASELLSSLSS